MQIFKATFLFRNLLVLVMLLTGVGAFAQKTNYRNVPVVDTAVGHASFYTRG